MDVERVELAIGANSALYDLAQRFVVALETLAASNRKVAERSVALLEEQTAIQREVLADARKIG